MLLAAAEWVETVGSTACPGPGRSDGETPAHPSPFPTAHLPPAWGRAAASQAGATGEGRRRARSADGCDGGSESSALHVAAARPASAPSERACSAAAASVPHVSAHLLGRYRHDRQTCTHCPRGESAAHKHLA